jgi:hypothetical protein
MAKKTPWGWIIVGIVVFTMVIGVGLVAVAGFLVYQQFSFKSTPSTAHSAHQTFDEVARRFKGQEPMLVIEDGEAVLNKSTLTHKRSHIETLHVMAWDPQEERVISLDIPFWLIRMTNGHPIRLSAGDRNDDERPNLKITAADLERHGPGLILLQAEPGGDRVIVWAQ